MWFGWCLWFSNIYQQFGTIYPSKISLAIYLVDVDDGMRMKRVGFAHGHTVCIRMYRNFNTSRRTRKKRRRGKKRRRCTTVFFFIRFVCIRLCRSACICINNYHNNKNLSHLQLINDSVYRYDDPFDHSTIHKYCMPLACTHTHTHSTSCPYAYSFQSANE